jgi:hypothetical protein
MISLSESGDVRPLKPSDYYRTPAFLLELVRQVSPIALDPCGTPDNWTGARHCFTENGRVTKRTAEYVDGLAAPWRELSSLGLAFVNPPYSSRHLGRWVSRCAREGQHGCSVLALLPANTDTRWFQNILIPSEPVLCFWMGRLRFVDPDTNEQAVGAGRFASLLSFWGSADERQRFRAQFRPKGWVI